MKKAIVLGIFMTVFAVCTVFASQYGTKVPLNGNSMANPKLQYDTLMSVYMAVGTKIKTCGNMQVVNTSVTRQPYNLKSQNGQYVEGMWEELWTVNACGKKVSVPIKFVLDSTGATYLISPENILIK